jgi:hypothetical protein
MTSRLHAFAARLPEDAAPYDFAEFQRRTAARAAVQAPPRWRTLRYAAVAAPLGLILVIAAVSRTSPLPETSAAPLEPALVRVGPDATLLDLEDRIAVLDVALSHAPGFAAEERAVLEDGRNTLATSLQQVRYARTLLTY